MRAICQSLKEEMGEAMMPHQVGVAVPGGIDMLMAATEAALRGHGPEYKKLDEDLKNCFSGPGYWRVPACTSCTARSSALMSRIYFIITCCTQSTRLVVRTPNFAPRIKDIETLEKRSISTNMIY